MDGGHLPRASLPHDMIERSSLRGRFFDIRFGLARVDEEFRQDGIGDHGPDQEGQGVREDGCDDRKRASRLNELRQVQGEMACEDEDEPQGESDRSPAQGEPGRDQEQADEWDKIDIALSESDDSRVPEAE